MVKIEQILRRSLVPCVHCFQTLCLHRERDCVEVCRTVLMGFIEIATGKKGHIFSDSELSIMAEQTSAVLKTTAD